MNPFVGRDQGEERRRRLVFVVTDLIFYKKFTKQ